MRDGWLAARRGANDHGIKCPVNRIAGRPKQSLPIGSVIAIAAILFASSAAAHTGTGLAGGFGSGFRHPFTGADHLLAMLSVGLWGAFLGRPLIFALPV